MSQDGSDPASSGVPALPQPWWIPPFLGRVPAGLAPEHLQLLGVIALALVFESYDISMMGAALKQIRESFGLDQVEVGRLTGLVRLGAIPAILIIPIADRLGRRRIFIASVVGMSFATFFTAFTQNEWQYIATQLVARTFLVAGSATAFVIISEEFPAEHRGWGIGILGALGAMGFGLGALGFAFLDYLPYGWRALYVLGLGPLVLVPMLRRSVPETKRFRTEFASRDDSDRWWQPIAHLVTQYPGRTLVILIVGFLVAGGHAPAFQPLADYVQTQHSWSKGQYSTMILVGGMFGIVGNIYAGRLADRFGRRRVGFLILAAFPIFAFGLWNTSGALIPLMWTPMIFVQTGGSTIIRAITTELFPT